MLKTPRFDRSGISVEPMVTRNGIFIYTVVKCHFYINTSDFVGKKYFLFYLGNFYIFRKFEFNIVSSKLNASSESSVAITTEFSADYGSCIWG